MIDANVLLTEKIFAENRSSGCQSRTVEAAFSMLGPRRLSKLDFIQRFTENGARNVTRSVAFSSDDQLIIRVYGKKGEHGKMQIG